MIKLDKEKETLLVPLYGKAIESRKKSPVLFDPKALEIVEDIDYDFDSLKIPGKTNTMMCLRAKLIDNFTREFLADNPQGIVLHLGCGLDSRYDRINNSDVDWYDLDYPEVIDIRRRFYPKTDKYHLIPSSVTEPGWIENLPVNDAPCLVIAEGLFMYLKEAEIRALLLSLRQKLEHFTLIFDAYSVFTSKQVKNHPSIKKTGAVIHWGIDDPQEIVQWDNRIRFIREINFTSNEELRNLDFGTRLTYRIAHLFPMARKAQRILVYETGLFPEPIRKLPKADTPFDGATAYLSQSDKHQILFMQFEQDVELPEHKHAAQAGIVLEGKIDLIIDGIKHTFNKGDRYYIPQGIQHSGKIYAGYADITFFDEPARYSRKNNE